jgi:adenylate cyclase
MIALQFARLRPEERQVLEVGSVAGIEFATAEVATALATDIIDVETWCEGLVHRQHFLQRKQLDTWPDGTVTARYGFRHALYQQVVYEHVSPIWKQRLHYQIGMRLEHGYGEQVRDRAAVLAIHFAQGRDYQRAISYRYQAAENALQRHAYQEAIHHLSAGLQLLQTLPDSSARTQQELMFLITLGVPLVATKGYGAPEVEYTYGRAQKLCQHTADSAESFLALRGLWNWYLLKAELLTASACGAQLLRLAQRQQDSALVTEAHRVMGCTLFFRGEFLPARTCLAQGIALYDQQQHRSLAWRYGADPGVVCRVYAAWLLGFMGYPDQALQRVYEALHLARELSHPFTLAFALSIVVDVHHLRREREATREWAEAVITLSTEQGIAQWLANGLMERGWVLVEQGCAAEGVAQMHEGLAAWQATGANLAVLYRLFLLAEAYAKIGQLPEALRLLDEALTRVEQQGERWWEAELYRLKGELLLQRTVLDEQQAEACLQQALAVARRQQAKLLELRAATSLSRLWWQQGKRAAAFDILAPTYHWFTEGFDTADLREAQTLLATLSG